jgi:uncharacterized protein YjlB
LLLLLMAVRWGGTGSVHFTVGIRQMILQAVGAENEHKSVPFKVPGSYAIAKSQVLDTSTSKQLQRKAVSLIH